MAAHEAAAVGNNVARRGYESLVIWALQAFMYIEFCFLEPLNRTRNLTNIKSVANNNKSRPIRFTNKDAYIVCTYLYFHGTHL